MTLLNIQLVYSSHLQHAELSGVSLPHLLMILTNWQVWSADENWWFRAQFRGKAAAAEHPLQWWVHKGS